MSPPDHGRRRREVMEAWLDVFRGYALASLVVAGQAVSAENLAYLVGSALALAVVVFDHLRKREPSKAVSARLAALEADVKALKKWRGS